MRKYGYEYHPMGKGKPLALWDISEGRPGRMVADLKDATHEEALAMFEGLKSLEEKNNEEEK